jgi:hypothetical protein
VNAEQDAEQVLAAAELLADAIRAGRLPKKPPMETLARIAAIVTVGGRATARGWTPKRSKKEARAIGQPSTQE